MNIFIILLIILFICIIPIVFYRKKIIVWSRHNKKKAVALMITGLVTSSAIVSLSIPDDLPPIPDAPVDPAAYDYWYAPQSSFGISEIKTVNWSYFKQLFLAHTDWMLEYKRYSYSEWTDGDQYLTIERTWNNSGFWKFNLILDAPVDVYSARFTFGIDLPCLQYVERDGYEVWINYTANATEIYSVMFNWSDIASIPGLIISKGRTDDMFWFRFRRDNIPAGHYEFDPTFGEDDENTGDTDNDLNDVIWGRYDAPASSGTVDSIHVYIHDGTIKDVQAALYTYVDYSSNYAGTTLANGLTDIIECDFEGSGWMTFPYSGTKPTVVGSTNYYICVWGDTTAANFRIKRTTDYQKTWYKVDAGQWGWDSPITGETGSGVATIIAYATYTESVSNTAPTIEGEIPANQSTSIGLTPVCNVTASDADGDTLNVTFWENTSGTYVMQQNNNSVSANISVQWDDYTEAKIASTKYWWRVYVDDGTENVSETYHFTTAANDTWDFDNNCSWIIKNDTDAKILRMSWKGDLGIMGTEGTFTDKSIWAIVNSTDVTILNLSVDGNLDVLGTIYEDQSKPADVIWNMNNSLWLQDDGDLYIKDTFYEGIT